MTPHRWKVVALLGALALGYLWWVRPLVSRPLMADEVHYAELAMKPRPAVAPLILHPPLYPDLLRASEALLGWRLETFRWLGVLCFLAQLGLVYAMAQRLQSRAGPLAALMWLTHPMAIQGSLILDVDNTLLAVWMSAWLLVWLESPWPLRSNDCLRLGLLLFLSLWTKLSTPWALLLALLGFSLQQRQLKAGIAAVAHIAAWGIGCFVISALLYQRADGMSLAVVWQHNTSSVMQGLPGTSGPVGAELVNRLGRLSLWFNPGLLALAALIGAWLITRRVHLATPKSGLIWWYLLLVGVGYCVVRGTHFGFAKYHYPVLPTLIALVSAGCVALGFPTTKRHWWVIGGTGLVAALACRFVVGDVLYLVNYTLRMAFLAAPAQVPDLFRSIALRVAGWALLWALCWLAVRYTVHMGAALSLMMSLLILALSMNLATNVLQRTTAYSTTYCYGRSARDLRALADWLKQEHRRDPTASWVGPEDVFVRTQIRNYQEKNFWEGPMPLLKALGDGRVRGVIVSPIYNSIGTYREILQDPDVEQALRLGFDAQQHGEYTVWLRRSLGQSSP